MKGQSLTNLFLVRYGLLGLALSFVGIPLYINLPKFYADTYHISLQTLGVILLLLRIGDAFIDPILGRLSDLYGLCNKKMIFWGMIGIVLSFNTLFWMPSAIAVSAPAFWFALGTGLTYLFYSFVSINFYGLGVSLTTDPFMSTRISAYRESIILVGILIASALPPILMEMHPPKTTFKLYGFIFLLLTFFILLLFPSFHSPKPQRSSYKFKDFYSIIKKDTKLIWIYIIFFVNSLPAAMTSTLFMFYVSDVLQAEKKAGYFLMIYFLAAAISTALWTIIANKIGKMETVLIAMIFSLLSFSGAYFLTLETVIYYYPICFLSGLGLGGELVIFPSLLSDFLKNNKGFESSAFGIWQALSKLSLALAAGICLPLLAYFGYESSQSLMVKPLHILSIFYALIPLSIKFLAILLLLFRPTQVDKDLIFLSK